ncbi:MAG: hydantoinase/oxoprolinase family protein [Alphaproteobacteria bacterium]|nr:hydantoinase/oxoprolinase family protein [Alphaproteobacteria bacterium]
MTVTYRVGVDIGGTFTDIVLLGSDGTIHTKKISSSVGNYAQAIVDGLTEVFVETGLDGGAIEEIRHGTTVASNAILEHKGARVGLITTKGFRDVLEIRTLRMPKLYDLTWTKPEPLVERYLRKVVDERIDHRGHVDRALDPADAERVVDALLAEKVEAIAICLLNSFTNPVHEMMLRDIVARKAPHLPLSVSFEVLPEIKEYERTSTTVINAYVMPIVATYLRALRQGLDGAGIPARLLLMQSNGGLTTDTAAAERPMNIIESGPAGGVVGAQALARAKDLKKIITFDMGGTTAKASMVEDGEIARAHEYAVGGTAGGPRERRRLARPGLLRQGRRSTDDHRCECASGLHQPRSSRGRRAEAECRQGAGGVRGKDRQAVGHAGGEGGLRSASDRGLQHDPRHQGGVDRARPRSTRVRPVRLRRQRPAVRRRHGRGAGHFAYRGATLGRSLLVLRTSLCRCRTPLCPHLPATSAARRSQGDRCCMECAGKAGRGSACHRRVHRHQGEAEALGIAALQGTELRSHRVGARRPDRRGHGEASRRILRAGTREDLWSPRRPRRAGRTRGDPGGGIWPARGRRRAAAGEVEPGRTPRPGFASRLLW